MTKSRMRMPAIVLTALGAMAVCPLALAQAAPAPSAKTSAATSAKVSPVAPRKEQVQAIVQEAYNKFKGPTVEEEAAVTEVDLLIEIRDQLRANGPT